MPYKITLLHLYAYFGLHNHVKFSLANEGSITEDASGSSALLLSLKTNNKNSTLIFLKYFAKTLNTNPFIGNSISLSDLVLINSLGFSALHSFYDGLLCKNNFSKLPVVCNKKLQLPKFLISDEMIPDENWYITPDRKEEGVSIEFFASAVRINMITGSEESIKFYQSILDCECQEIFRSKFIQYYIDYKWNKLRIFGIVECVVYLLYIIFLSVQAFTTSNTTVNVFFYLFGFSLNIYEVFGVFGGFEWYFKNVWNIIDLLKFVSLITLANFDINSNGFQSTLLVLSLLSWARGRSYFRINSSTRYMINLINQVIQDIFSFLVISAYSTIAFSFILMLMGLSSGTDFFGYFQISYLINLGNINNYDYTTIQWICFIIATIINPIIMMNLIISIMGDTYSRVQEGKEVADYKELTSLVLEIEIFAIWKRHEKSSQRLHVCKEVETKEFAKNWLGKVRELKSMIHEFKGNQMKVIKSNNIIIIKCFMF